MRDNGLIKYYRIGNYAKDGCLDLQQLSLLDPLSRVKVGARVQKLKIGDKWFYVKYTGMKEETDSEVLLSQVYYKAGIRNAVYTPSKMFCKWKFKTNDTVISNDVSNPHKNFLAENFFMFHGERGRCRPVLFPTKKPSGEQLIETFFTKKAQRDMVLMQTLDVASYNVDRKLNNFFFEANDAQITGVITIDNGSNLTYGSKYGVTAQDLQNASFTNFLGRGDTITRAETIQELKTNETVNDVITPGEIAKTLGDIDIPKVAQDIEQTIGYKIDDKIVEVLDASITSMAEELSK